MRLGRPSVADKVEIGGADRPAAHDASGNDMYTVLPGDRRP